MDRVSQAAKVCRVTKSRTRLGRLPLTHSASAIYQDPLWSQHRPRGVCPVPSLLVLSILSLSGCHSVQCRGKIGTAQLPRPVSQSIPGPPGHPSIRGYPIFRQDAQWGLNTSPAHQQRFPRGALRPASSAGSSPDVGEKGVDVPGKHGDHVGDDEGSGRPGHQQEGGRRPFPGESTASRRHRREGAALYGAGPRGRRAGLPAPPGGGGGARGEQPRAAGLSRGSATAGQARLREGGEARRAERGSWRRGGRPGWVGAGGPGLLRNQ